MTTNNKAETEKFLQEAEYFKAQAELYGYQAAQEKIKLERLQRETARELSLNLTNRVYDFTYEVNDTTCESVIQTMSMWARMSRDPITVRFTSPGGDIIRGLALHDAIGGIRQRYGIHVTTVALGMAASMAAVVLQAGDKRIVGPNAYILVHEAEAFSMGTVSQLEDESKFIRKLNDRLYDILASRAKIKRSEIVTKARRKDWWIDAQECVQFGLADEIGGV